MGQGNSFTHTHLLFLPPGRGHGGMAEKARLATCDLGLFISWGMHEHAWLQVGSLN